MKISWKQGGKALLAILALALTACLGKWMLELDRAPENAPAPLKVVRVWLGDRDSALNGWIKNRAAAYEKETGRRVYLRSVRGGDLAALKQADSGAMPPDAVVSYAGGETVALRGYALIVRDETVASVTPPATGALFIRPTATPGPSPTPAAWPEKLGAVLSPEKMMNALPGTVKSVSPADDLAAGGANAALLTPSQAARLPFGFVSFALPDGKGFAPLGAEAYSEAGSAFVEYLLTEASQRALEKYGLFSPSLRLYAPDDPLRYLIDRERPSPLD